MAPRRAPETALTIVVACTPFGLLPDLDLYLSNYVATIHHHGVVHSVLGVTLLAVLVGPLVGWGLRTLLGGSKWFSPRASRRALAVGTLGVWVAGLSHLFADMLSAPDIAPPIEPLWPLYAGRIVLLDVFWYSSTLATVGLFLVGVALNVVLWYATAMAKRAGIGR